MNPAFTMPNEYSDLAKYSATMQVHYTLCHPAVGLYGRTAIQKPPAGVPTSPSDLNLDYVVMFHSDLDLTETYLLCEIVVNIHDK